MTPIEFKGCNTTYGENQPEYQPLPAMHAKDENGTIVTAWQLTDDDLERLKQTKTLYLQILTGYNHLQPVFLTTNPHEVGIEGEHLPQKPTPINPEDDAS